MVDELNNTPGRKIPGRGRGRAAKFDHDLVNALEHQEKLKIWHLGRYANWCGMPPGAIILFSQLASHLRDGDLEDMQLSKSIAEAVKEVCQYVIDSADQLAVRESDKGAGAPRDRKLEALVRGCEYKDQSEEQKRHDARLVHALHRILSRYPPEAKELYRRHARKKFRGTTPKDPAA